MKKLTGKSSISYKMVKKRSNVIYSQLSYENAYAIKKNMLQTQADLLNILKTMEEYKLLRKKEFMFKIKMKNSLGEAKDSISKLISSVPQTDGIKIAKKENIKKQKEIEQETNFSVEAQLQDIKRRLQEL